MTETDLLSVSEVCRFFGGMVAPIDRSTLYRGIRKGLYPKPVKIGEKLSRWRREDCEAALQRMIESTSKRRTK